jgi:hypothetical protein
MLIEALAINSLLRQNIPATKKHLFSVNRNHFEDRREESYSTRYASREDGLLGQLGLIPRIDVSSINRSAMPFVCRRTTGTFST